jgi:hypothetical protein
MSYDSNLALPICPKCKDSKEVIRRDEQSTKMNLSTYFAYTCNKCMIFWDSTGFTSEIEGKGLNQ